MSPDRARQLLDEEERRLRGLRDDERQRHHESLEKAAGDLSTFDQHPADSGTDTHDRELDETVLRSLEFGLEEVASARSRLEDGTYGRCQTCGEPIPDERLEAQPTARFCVRHKAEQEHQAGVSER